MSSERSEFDLGSGLLESTLVIWLLNQKNVKAVNAFVRLVPASILLQSVLLIFAGRESKRNRSITETKRTKSS
jgi:hypothetical protein